MKNNPKLIIIHCSDISEKILSNQLESINTYHRDEKGFPKSSLDYYVGYHYLVTGDTLVQCRQDYDEGAHCNQTLDGISINFQSVGICWGGDGDIEYPSITHYMLLQKKVWDIQDRYGIDNSKVFFHRKFATSKTCPGGLLTDAWLAQLLRRPIKLPPSPYVKPTQFCTEEKVEIEKQKGIISSLMVFINSLLKK